MTSPLDGLAGAGKPLSIEPPDAKEFDRLKHSGQTRLKDALNKANSLEGRFDLAYNAAHAFCLAALRYRGFARVIGTSCSRFCRTRWGSVRKCGECSPNATRSETVASMKAISISTSVSSRTWSVPAAR
jgi:hypothetical protein